MKVSTDCCFIISMPSAARDKISWSGGSCSTQLHNAANTLHFTGFSALVLLQGTCVILICRRHYSRLHTRGRVSRRGWGGRGRQLSLERKLVIPLQRDELHKPGCRWPRGLPQVKPFIRIKRKIIGNSYTSPVGTSWVVQSNGRSGCFTTHSLAVNILKLWCHHIWWKWAALKT